MHFVRDIAFGSDVRFAREDAEHITSLCDGVAIHHYGEAITSLRQRRNITFSSLQNQTTGRFELPHLKYLQIYAIIMLHRFKKEGAIWSILFAD